jgi:hypothetical protein
MLLETILASSGYLSLEYILYKKTYTDLLRGKLVRDGDRLVETKDYESFVKFYSKKFNYNAPMYIGPSVGNMNFGIPVGERIEESWEPVFTKAVPKGGREVRDMNYASITDFDDGTASSIQYINTPEALQTKFEEVSVPMNQFPITLPMKVVTVTLPEHGTVYTSQNYKICGTNRFQVAKRVALQPVLGRRPLVVVAGGVLACSGALALLR